MLGANDSILTGLGTEPFRRHACDHGRDEAAKEAKERCTHTADLSPWNSARAFPSNTVNMAGDHCRPPTHSPRVRARFLRPHFQRGCSARRYSAVNVWGGGSLSVCPVIASICHNLLSERFYTHTESGALRQGLSHHSLALAFILCRHIDKNCNWLWFQVAGPAKTLKTRLCTRTSTVSLRRRLILLCFNDVMNARPASTVDMNSGDGGKVCRH